MLSPVPLAPCKSHSRLFELCSWAPLIAWLTLIQPSCYCLCPSWSRLLSTVPLLTFAALWISQTLLCHLHCPLWKQKVSHFTDHSTQVLSVATSGLSVTGQLLCPNQDNSWTGPQLCKAFPPYSLSLLTKRTSVEFWGLTCLVFPPGRLSHRCSVWLWCQFFGTKTKHKRAQSNPKTNYPQKIPTVGKGKKSNLYNSTQFLATINVQSLVLPEIRYF